MHADAYPVTTDLGLETAAEHVTTNLPVVSPEMNASEALRAVLGGSFDTANLVIVLGQRKLLGIVRLEALLAAPADSLVGKFMDREPLVVAPGIDQEVAAWKVAAVQVRARSRFRERTTRHGDSGSLVNPHLFLDCISGDLVKAVPWQALPAAAPPNARTTAEVGSGPYRETGWILAALPTRDQIDGGRLYTLGDLIARQESST